MLRWFENLIKPYSETPPEPVPEGFAAFMWACLKGMRRYVVAMMSLTALIAMFEALMFAMLGNVVDWLSNTPPALLWTNEKGKLLLLAGIILASPLAVWLQTQIKYQSLSGNFPMALRWRFHRLMLGQSMSFFQDEFAARITTKVLQTSLAVRDTVFVLGDIMVFVVIYVVTMTVVAGAFDTFLLIPFLAWVAVYICSVIYFVPRLSRTARAQADARSLMTGRITDAYTNMATVKLFSHANREASFARQSMQEFMVPVYRQMRLVTGFEFTNHSLSMLLIVGSSGSALWLWTQGAIGIGAVAAVTAMALRLNGISHWIMWEMAALFEHIGTVQDGMKTLSRPQQVVDHPQAKALQVSHGDIQFKDVRFSYGGERQVIDKLNLHIKAGEKIGLVGRSGAGKSTIVNLLLRFHDLSAGQILIDGQDIAQVTQTSLRKHIGMVTQDTALLHRSVRDNLMYGKPNASEAEMVAAAQGAEAHTFIQTLEDPQKRTGYDSHVGERGVKLSGGQRQRIAIARVMLKDAPILLLDEATSALDSEVEAAIQSSLYRLMTGKTVVAIAHRLSTIAAMDRLIVIDEGRIVEEGDHASLLAKGGLYARLWSHQSGGFLGESI